MPQVNTNACMGGFTSNLHTYGQNERLGLIVAYCHIFSRNFRWKKMLFLFVEPGCGATGGHNI